MDTKQLKTKILDLAIRGKLLSPETLSELKKSPDYETADVLLKKLRAEKEEKISKGELKRDKKDSYIFVGDDNRHYEKFADGSVKDIEDEIPFEVPEGWTWCRLGEIFTHATGKALKKSNSNGTLRKYITTSNLYWNSFDFTEIRSMYFTDEELDKCTAKKGDLLVCNGGDVGRAAIWNFDYDICYQNHISRLRPKINEIDNKFYFYVIWLNKEKGNLIGKGIGITSLSASDLLNLYIPLPPLTEQKQIVAEIEKIFSLIDSLEKNKSSLQTAVKQAKSKILDLAIHGKLVLQDPADEPASVLLEKLRAEKEAKIAKGELKRDKNDSYIYKSTTDNCHYEKFADGTEEEIEVPFEVPDNWSWCRLGSICDYGKCKNVSTSEINDETWVLDLEDIEKDSGRILKFLSFKVRKSASTKHIFKKGDILYSKLRPYLNKVVIAPKDGVCTSEILPLDFNGILINGYAQYLLMSSFFLESVNLVTYGIKMPRLGTDDAKKMLLPVPPLNEQLRIVKKIKQFQVILDQIALNLV